VIKRDVEGTIDSVSNCKVAVYTQARLPLPLCALSFLLHNLRGR
jgi:hypothetical protein